MFDLVALGEFNRAGALFVQHKVRPELIPYVLQTVYVGVCEAASVRCPRALAGISDGFHHAKTVRYPDEIRIPVDGAKYSFQRFAARYRKRLRTQRVAE